MRGTGCVVILATILIACSKTVAFLVNYARARTSIFTILKLQPHYLNLFSCGSCGYPLNLSSSQRVVSSLDSKALRKGTICFLCIDESRFQQLDELKCAPHLQANGSLRFHQLRTKLLCGKCGNDIGHGHVEDIAAGPQIEGSDSSSGSGTPEHKRYCVKIKALQPSLSVEPIAPAAG
ncbi:hypothetical protein GOP47_0004228 [Adiantum capillus-veneris]|uniref:Uncharacterized protein n=1 Tax=Adiantum capillus-veneris TaxID=13818 RepID=A0A9D4V746_ADICA|nr:hypothetical protein GOP47_0004228 [Adiantum capillus-veneris]